MRIPPKISNAIPPDVSPSRGGGERSEPTPSEGLTSGAPVPPPTSPPPSTEVPSVARRRRFTAEYKLGVVREAEACRAPGEIGALLRRERIYSSLLSTWRIQHKRGAMAALSDVRRGRKPASPEIRENQNLRQELAEVGQRLKHAELVIEVQKKVSELLGIPLNPPPPARLDS